MKPLLVFSFLTIATMAETAPSFQGSIERLDPALDQLIAPGTVIEVLASGFNWSEGPVWKDGKVLFSDVPENAVFSWKEGDNAAAMFLKPSGNLAGEGQGSNGLALDAKGALILCQHGERRIARLESDGKFSVIADRCAGKRFNSPNDLVISRKGTIFFTDPPYGLPKGTEPDAPWHGIYAVQADAPGSPAILLLNDLRFPNGIALSPDEKTLYIAVSDKDNTRIMAYDLLGKGKSGIAGVIQGTIIPKPENGREFFNAQKLKTPERKGGCDGLKVDAKGNVWSTGPGGVLILNSAGKHLGTILTGQATANCAWGGEDRQTLYITADMFLLRVKTKIKGL